MYLSFNYCIIASLKTLGSSTKCSQLKYFYYFGKCSSELAERVPLPHSCGSFTSHSNRLHNFSVTFSPKSYKDFYVKSFFPRTARLWNSLLAECFPLTYDIKLTNIFWSSRPLEDVFKTCIENIFKMSLA